ncbi:MAG: hypothetical protein ACOYEV_01915 [Candidatus Nanopelagicales bacterium]
MSDALEPIEPNAGGIVPSEELVGRGAVIGRLLKFSAPPHDGAVDLVVPRSRGGFDFSSRCGG